MRKDKKKIEELEEALSNAVYKISSLKIINRANEDTIKQLRADIAGKDEKYAELLEKYIAMMERAAKLDEQTVENTPDLKLEQIFLNFQALIDKWFHNNGYDYQLDSGFKELRKKYLGW